MKTNTKTINKTAREHCKDRRTPCCWEPYIPGKAQWRKCEGYIVVADEYNDVINGMIYAIELHNDTPAIHRYTRKGRTGQTAIRRYSYRSLVTSLKDPTKWDSHEITFDDMIEYVKKHTPSAAIPTQSRFCLEYGIKYDRYSDEMINYVGLIND